MRFARRRARWRIFPRSRGSGLIPPPLAGRIKSAMELRSSFLVLPSEISRPLSRGPSMFGYAHLQPIVSIIAGVLILLIPRLLNYIVAIYLIVVGLIGLGVVR